MNRALALMALTSLLAGCGGKDPAAARPEATPVAVQTVTVARQDVPRALTVSGALLADEEADVAAEVAGAVRAAPADRGDLVEKGAALLEIDPTLAALQASEARAAADAAKAASTLADDECRRAEAVAQAGGMSPAELERAQTQCAQAREQLEAATARAGLAATNLGRTTVRAPFTGMVMERFVSPGDYVAPGRVVARVVTVDPLRLQISVPERAAAQVQPGAALRFSVNGLPGASFDAVVARISPALRERTRDLIVEADVPNADGRLKPGNFALVELALPPGPGLVAPASALRERGDTIRVFVNTGGRAEERLVDVGARLGDLVEIRDGLREGEAVIAPLPAEVSDGVPLAGN